MLTFSHLQYDHRISKGHLDADKSSNSLEHSKYRQDQNEKKIRKSPNLEGFNETGYIYEVQRDPDTYKRNAFNQEESDKLHSDRSIPDTRHYKLV